MFNILKIGNFTIYENQIVYNERDTVAVPETISIHLVNGDVLTFEGDQAVALAQYFEDQAKNINI